MPLLEEVVVVTPPSSSIVRNDNDQLRKGSQEVVEEDVTQESSDKSCCLTLNSHCCGNGGVASKNSSSSSSCCGCGCAESVVSTRTEATHVDSVFGRYLYTSSHCSYEIDNSQATDTFAGTDTETAVEYYQIDLDRS